MKNMNCTRFPMPRIYLAGLISTTRPSSLSWRKDVAKKLGEDFLVLDPLRHTPDLQTVSTDEGLNDPRLPGDVLMALDHEDVQNSNLILANLSRHGGDRPLVGTLFELGWAYHAKIPVIGFVDTEPDDHFSLIFNHPFITSCGDIYWNLDEALEAVHHAYLRYCVTGKCGRR